MENNVTLSSIATTASASHLRRTENTAQPSANSLALHNIGPTQPPDRAIELRTATSVAAASENHCEHSISKDKQPLSFEGLVDELLNIPMDEYIQLDPAIMPRLERSYKECLDRYNNDPEAISIIKIKHLLNRAIYDWQTSHDREKTRKLLVSLHDHAGKTVYLYLESWILLKVVKDILHGKPVAEEDTNQLLMILNEKTITGRFSGFDSDCLPTFDLMSLKSFYYLEALSVINGGSNFERGLRSMYAIITIQANNYLFYSPISFSSLDYVRLAPGDMTDKLDEQKKQLPDSVPGSVMQIFIMFFLQKDGEKFNGWLRGYRHFDHLSYTLVRHIVFQFFQLVTDILKHLPPQTISAERGALNDLLNRYEKAYRTEYTELLPLIVFLRAEIILLLEHKSRFNFAKVARLYEDIATGFPNHLTSAYNYYCDADLLRKASEVAARYASYWVGTNDMLAEYWSDISARAWESATSPHERGKIPAKARYDIDTILQQLSDESPLEPQRETSRKKGRQKRKGRLPGKNSQQQTAQKPSNGKEEARAETAENDKTRLCKPVIKALPFVDNNPDGLPGQYQIKSTQGAIRPYEKLLSRHWNPIIKKTLGLIRMARADADREREQQIYQKVLNNPRLRACIGIERIWEEYAWTELHKFDDCFRTQAMPASLYADAKQWINDARELFILPSLAYCLGLDQIHLHIKPEAVQESALRLVAQPQVAAPGVNQEIRFRLRCLFSSMGHTYSLSAMACPDQAAQLMQTARKWYGFKTIDPLYVHKSRATQEADSCDDALQQRIDSEHPDQPVRSGETLRSHSNNSLR